jgi:hypothetical protein
VGKLEGKRTLERPRRILADNNQMEVEEVGWDGVEWMELVQDRGMLRALVSNVKNLRVP